MKKTKIGSCIPEFTLPDLKGNLFNINSVPGKKNIVIYFYPKDNSPGCTKEACPFRDKFVVFNEADEVISSISGQSVESHKEYTEQNRLNYTLLIDPGNIVRKLFGVPAEFLG